MPWMTGGGQYIPAGLPYPAPKTLEQWLCTDTEITFKSYIRENDENFLISNISCLFTTTSHYKCLGWRVGGNISQLVYLTPHPRLWSSDCVQIMKMTFKCYISENDENSLKFRHFLHVYNNQSLEMPWMTGGGQPIPAGLSYPPPMIFEQWLAIDFVIAVNCFNNYKCFIKYRYCLLVYKNPFLEILSFTGGGQHIPAGLPYPPPPSSPTTTQDIAAVNFYR